MNNNRFDNKNLIINDLDSKLKFIWFRINNCNYYSFWSYFIDFRQLERSTLSLFWIILGCHHVFEHLFFALVGTLLICNFVDFIFSHWLSFVFRSWFSSSFSNRGSQSCGRSSDVVRCSSGFRCNSLSLVERNTQTNGNANQYDKESSCSSHESFFFGNFSTSHSE